MTAVSKHYAVSGAKEILQQHHSKFHRLGVQSCQNVFFITFQPRRNIKKISLHVLDRCRSQWDVSVNSSAVSSRRHWMFDRQYVFVSLSNNRTGKQ